MIGLLLSVKLFNPPLQLDKSDETILVMPGPHPLDNPLHRPLPAGKLIPPFNKLPRQEDVKDFNAGISVLNPPNTEFTTVETPPTASATRLAPSVIPVPIKHAVSPITLVTKPNASPITDPTADVPVFKIFDTSFIPVDIKLLPGAWVFKNPDNEDTLFNELLPGNMPFNTLESFTL